VEARLNAPGPIAATDHVFGERADAALPSRFGAFRIAVFRGRRGETEVIAISSGDLTGAQPVLVRLHSECLTGEALGSLRCDCGEQLERALAAIASSGRGVLLYLRHEGRGIGLFDKVRAYALQDRGLDTVDANVALGLPVDRRDYAAAAAVLRQLGIRRVRLLTNNPDKTQALVEGGVEVVERVPLETMPNLVNLGYLRTKATRMGHLLETLRLSGARLAAGTAPDRPEVTVHYAQTLDGRIAAHNGDARWVSGDSALRLAHQLRAEHDAVLVGIGTVLADDPRLTVRLVHGSSPTRVIVDSTLRLPLAANVVADGAARTLVATTRRAPASKREALRRQGAEILLVRSDDAGRVDLTDLLPRLGRLGIRSVLIEGGRGIITSAMRSRLVDRLIVCIAPKVLGEGIAAVGDLQIDYLRDALKFSRASFIPCGDDLIFYGEPVRELPQSA
jgi:GTP cyclohydrolase II